MHQDPYQKHLRWERKQQWTSQNNQHWCQWSQQAEQGPLRWRRGMRREEGREGSWYAHFLSQPGMKSPWLSNQTPWKLSGAVGDGSHTHLHTAWAGGVVLSAFQQDQSVPSPPAVLRLCLCCKLSETRSFIPEWDAPLNGELLCCLWSVPQFEDFLSSRASQCRMPLQCQVWSVWERCEQTWLQSFLMLSYSWGKKVHFFPQSYRNGSHEGSG